MRRLAVLLLAVAVSLTAAAAAAADDRLAAAAQQGVWINTDRYTPPIFDVRETACTQTVRLRTPNPQLQARWRHVPLPCHFAPSAGSDGEAVVLDRRRHRTYEFWQARYDAPGYPGAWSAQWGGGADDEDLAGHAGVRAWNGNDGAQASGLSMVPGVVRVKDLARGRIAHVVHLVVPQACRRFRAPARRSDGTATSGCIEYGTRFRLPANFDCSSLAFVAHLLCRAARDHGFVAADQSHGPLVIRFENWRRPDAPWAGGRSTLDPYADPTGPDYFGCRALVDSAHHARPDTSCMPDGEHLMRGFPWAALRAVG